MSSIPSLPAFGFVAVALVLGSNHFQSKQDAEPHQVIFQDTIHLGNDDTPEWPEAAASPDALDSFSFNFKDAKGCPRLGIHST
jgi:hypothetical protein